MRDGPNFPVLVVHCVVPAKLATSKSDGFVLSRRNLLPQETIPNLGLDFLELDRRRTRPMGTFFFHQSQGGVGGRR